MQTPDLHVLSLSLSLVYAALKLINSLFCGNTGILIDKILFYCTCIVLIDGAIGVKYSIGRWINTGLHDQDSTVHHCLSLAESIADFCHHADFEFDKAKAKSFANEDNLPYEYQEVETREV